MEKPENAQKKLTFRWYYERFLPVVVGSEYWSDKVRHYHLLSDKIPIGKANKMESNVTIEGEAWAMFVYDNCQERWTKQFNKKKTNQSKICFNLLYFCIVSMVNLQISVTLHTQVPRFRAKGPKQRNMRPSGLLHVKAKSLTEDGRKVLMRHTMSG